MPLREEPRMGGERGFTLIELLIVVVIIGVLAAIAVPQYGTTKEKAFDDAAISDLRNLMTAQEAYFFDHNEYAEDITALETEEGLKHTDGVGMSMTRVNPGAYRADASHDKSSHCYRVSMGTGTGQDIERVDGDDGGGDCSG